jgi:hypothetical protein
VDGIHLRMEFIVNRLDDALPGAPLRGKMYTAARVVMSLPGLLDMVAKLNSLVGQLQAPGGLPPASPPDGSPRVLN